ncbi:hypothetical protein Tco_0728560 [Tanacetum coccineum]|uniref:Ubiquitin-like domain-containing protein n=1 Tax=Tanacetum coccineum TaxID=301880 RepID=A0ABQ4YLG1_9ASTR
MIENILFSSVSETFVAFRTFVLILRLLIVPDSSLAKAFGKHWKEIHVTWAQLKKKRDKDTTLQDFDGALDLKCVETASRFLLTPSKLEGDDVTIFSDAVTIADLKKSIEDSTG